MKINIYLHIGLHKTGTKYLQHYIFSYLHKNKAFLYNPPILTQYLMDYLKADKHDRKGIYEYLIKEKYNLMKNNPDSTIFISREIMSGDLFSAYRDWDEYMTKLYKAMPEAKIIMFLRYQPDWLVSCYRESIHEHHYQTFTEFISYNKKKKLFEMPSSKRNTNGYAQLYALNLDYSKMVNKLYDLYKKENVSIYFHEDLIKDKEKTIKDILKSIDVGHVNIPLSSSIPNRGFSAFAINLSIYRTKIFKALGLSVLIHRPIFFFGGKSIPAGNYNISILNKEKYWSSYFYKDNEEIRSQNYPNLTFIEKIKREFTWRFFMKQRFDKVIYLDWDLGKTVQKVLREEYSNINNKLSEVVDINRIPLRYFSVSPLP